MKEHGRAGGRGKPVPPGAFALFLSGLVFLATLNLRPAITTVGPVLERIGERFALGEGALGVLGALPLIMFAILSLGASTIAARVGLERALWFALFAIAAGIAVRSLLGLPGLWAGTVIATGAIAVGNVLVPVIVRKDFPSHIAVATGVYTACMGFAAATASAVAAPVADSLGWESSLLLWAIPAFVVALLWTPRALASAPGSVRVPRSHPSVWRLPQAWWLTIFMGVQSATFYFMITWLPTLEVSRGASTDQAGIALFWYQISGICAGLLTPLVMRRTRTQLPAILLATLPIITGFVGLIWFPQFGVWNTLVLGAGSGVSLVVSLTLISLRGGDGPQTAALSGMVQSLGYLIAALAPAVAGLIAQRTGSLTGALVMMLCVAITQLTVGVKVSRER